MLRRLTLGLFILASAAAVVACSSNTTIPSNGGVQGQGPNFTTNTVYVSNTTQNTIEIFTPSPGPSATPQYTIGGSNTSMNGPAYLAFDSSKNLYVSTYSAATKASGILIFKEFATGNVLPFGSVPLTVGAQAHGIAILPSNKGIALAVTQPGAFFANAINLYSALSGGTLAQTNTIAGSSTQLNNPIGVAADASSNVYAANSGSGTITVYALPTPSPTPSGSPSPTPSPTPTPSSSPSASPSPTPTPVSNNLAPIETISCAPGAGSPSPCMTRPSGLTIDSSGNVYVTDPDNGTAPAIYVFASSQVACSTPPCTLSLVPSRFIAGSNTKLVNPTDVAVDSSGTIYVVDAGTGANTSMLLIFAPGATGNAAPNEAIPLPGSATGIALSP